MKGVELLQTNRNTISLSGILNIDTVVTIKEEVDLLLTGTNELSIDLAKISFSDSSGVALLLEWLKLAKGMRKKIYFTNIPLQMQRIIRVTGLDSVLK